MVIHNAALVLVGGTRGDDEDPSILDGESSSVGGRPLCIIPLCYRCRILTICVELVTYPRPAVQ